MKQTSSLYKKNETDKNNKLISFSHYLTDDGDENDFLDVIEKKQWTVQVSCDAIDMKF